MDKSRVEPTIFFIEKISFSLKLFSGHFYGQSFIKTVRGPLTLFTLGSFSNSEDRGEMRNAALCMGLHGLPRKKTFRDRNISFYIKFDWQPLKIHKG